MKKVLLLIHILIKRKPIKMKKIIILIIILSGFGNAYAQDSVLDKIAKQAVEIDSLKKGNKIVELRIDSLLKIIATNEISNKQLSSNHNATVRKYADSTENLKKELSSFEKYKSDKKTIETTISVKSDSIILLKKQITQKEDEIKTIIEKSKKDAVIEKDNGRNEVLNQLVYTYKNNSFDDLINSSSIKTVQRDKQIIGNNTEVNQIITDLEIYFNAINLFENKFIAPQVNDAISQVNLIKQQSKLVSTLKDNLDNFKTFNEGLIATIHSIIALDKKEYVKGMSEQVVKSKLNKVISEISKFVFDYNFNFVDYPYFSKIVLEVIERKRPNPDADISDLLNKIE
jgi:hypothetical protein